MKKNVEYLLAYYERSVVEKIVTFETVNELIKHLIPYIPDAINLNSLEDIIKLLHKTWNTVDANEWKLPYKIGDDGIARMMFRD